MQQNYSYSFREVLKFEGGYTNDPNDPGGATNLGIIQREYNAYRDREDKPQQSVKYITQAEANQIYREQYWDRLSLDRYPAGIDFCIFDAAVNNGVGAAQKFAQRANNKVNATQLVVDGILGIASQTAIAKCNPGAFIDAFCDERLRYDRTLKIWKYFGKGWTTRIESVRSKAKALAGVKIAAVQDTVVSRETTPTAPATGVLTLLINWIMGLFRGR